MTDIDDQVAAFRDELDETLSVDLEQTQRDLTTLTVAMIEARTHELAAVELREFMDARAHSKDYAESVAIVALSHVGLHAILTADVDQLGGAEGLLRRLQRLAFAARGLGLARGVTTRGGVA